MDPDRVADLFALVKGPGKTVPKIPPKIPDADDPAATTLCVLSHEQRQKIAAARRDRNLTRAQLATLANLKPDLVNALETGKPVQERTALAKINKALGLELAFGK
jgi:ribosome-binding protein aMBF1 (putative translation factor)